MKDKTISGYIIQRRLGVGGMAEVWYAENRIGNKAAVKILLPELCRNNNIVERFLTEAKTMVVLNHPNIRKVYDYGEIDGCPAIVMEYLDGDDLKARMKHGERFSDDDLVKWWNQLVDALTYTHSKGIVHRDIKPGNIFADQDGNIRLLDFGIAKVRESISSTQTGQKLGTLMYMSPEQVKDSKHIDYHTDIYSLAVTFVHLVTGRKPYDSDTTSDFEIQLNIVSKPLDLSELPDKWRNFLEPYLNKEASKRPELRHFDSNAPAPEPAKKEESTVIKEERPQPQKDEATIIESDTVKPERTDKPERPEPSANPPKKRKLGLWIGLGAAVVAVIVVVLLMSKSSDSSNNKTRNESGNETKYNPEEEAYSTLKDFYDSLEYVRNYGPDSKYYNEKHYEKLVIVYELLKYRVEIPVEIPTEELEIIKQEQPKPQIEAPKPQVTQIQVVENTEPECETACSEDGIYEEDTIMLYTLGYDFYEEEIVEEEIFDNAEEQPEFPGGFGELTKYISKNLKYPMQARESGIQGRVFVGFVIEKDGSLSNVEVLRGIGGGCDEEAVRVVKSLPKFKPGKQRGAPVRVKYSLPIVFRLN